MNIFKSLANLISKPEDKPTGLVRYTPAKGWTSIFSERRQARKQLQRAFPNLRSGRQWVKYRKAAKRLHKETEGQRGFDFFSLPTYRTA